MHTLTCPHKRVALKMKAKQTCWSETKSARCALKVVEQEQAFYHHPVPEFTLYTQELTALLAQQDGDNQTTQTATTTGQWRANTAVYGEIWGGFPPRSS